MIRMLCSCSYKASSQRDFCVFLQTGDLRWRPHPAYYQMWHAAEAVLAAEAAAAAVYRRRSSSSSGGAEGEVGDVAACHWLVSYQVLALAPGVLQELQQLPQRLLSLLTCVNAQHSDMKRQQCATKYVPPMLLCLFTGWPRWPLELSGWAAGFS